MCYLLSISKWLSFTMEIINHQERNLIIMGAKVKLSLCLLLCSVVFASVPLALCYEREELDLCSRQCQRHEGDMYEYLACQKRCQLQRREREQREGEGRGRETERDPERRFEECKQRCQQEGRRGEREHEKQCEQKCERQREEDEREQRRRGEGGRGENAEGPEREQREGEGRGRETERDPERRFEECKQRCQQEGRRGEREHEKQCEQKCERQREEDEREQRRRGEGGRGENAEDPRKQLEECSRECRQHEKSQQRRCQQQCEEQYQRQQRERGHEEINPRRWEGEEREREQEQEQTDNPYYFHGGRFQSRFRSEEGQIRVLENFARKSDRLRGIKNYRVAILEARPNTFVIPHHVDAETIIHVVKGKGTITFVWQEKKEAKRESYNLECGNVFRISAGTTVYLINTDQNEDLQVVNLVQPVNNPGQFKDYFAAGGENPQSYYNVFSTDLLEAALNTPSDQLERFFKQQGRRQGAIVRVSEEQMKALSRHASSQRQGGRGSARGPISLQNERPLYTNKFGKFYEANPEEFQQLKDVDVSVTFTDLNQGAMFLPHFNSRATIVFFVAEGKGRVEMACPHLASGSQQPHERGEHRGREEEEEEQTSGRFHKVTANLSPGDVFVIPAGHPVALIASQNQNLRLVGFGINGQDNQRNFLAGKDSIMNEVEREAIQISFNVKGREAEQIFKNQKESFFAEGPQRGGRGERREDERKGHPLLSSILNTAAFF